MPGCVYVVFCMDTEGPCDDPKLPDLLATWPKVDQAMDKLFSPDFRLSHLDRFGGSPRFGWFFLTWTGFQTNPVNRDFGYHKIRDHYLERWGEAIARYGDEEAWHYHHPDQSRVGNVWGLDWSILPEYDQIISRQILERNWFPTAYRAGGTILDNVSSRWVDKWFPIDYNNRAPAVFPDLIDWSEGVTDWKIYHPDPEDFRRPGGGRRRMARCLDLLTNSYQLSDNEIIKAFEQAQRGEDAILSVFDHDYRDILGRLQDLQRRLDDISGRYPTVPWRYSGPVEAVRRYLKAGTPRPLRMEVGQNGRQVQIWSSEPLYQSIPWIAVETDGGEVVHIEEGVERIDPNTWRWTIPKNAGISRVAFGGSTDLGTSDVVTLEPSSGTTFSFSHKAVEVHPTAPHDIWEHSKRFPESCVERASGAAEEMDSVRQATDLLRDHLVPGDSVLDVGCAAGHAWHSLRELGIQYSGIDSSSLAIPIGRQLLPDDGANRPHLRRMRLEDLPANESYDAVIALSTLYYFPMYHQPIEIMARATSRFLIIRSSFGEQNEIRYLPDVLLEPGFDTMRAYFNIFSRKEVQSLLETLGFKVSWLPDWRQEERLGGQTETVGGLSLPAEFLFAERISKGQTREELLGPELKKIADSLHTERGRLA
jgi:SAM-dependent methyltransferase